MSEIFVHNGIVDKVRAVRRSSSDEVLYLEATIHIKMDEELFTSQYGSPVTSDMTVPLPIGTEVNPGDVVAIHMQFVNPFGKRFHAALDVGENPADELDEDMLAEAAVERDDNFDDEDDINEAVIDVSQDA
jgi:hypothetical protein